MPGNHAFYPSCDSQYFWSPGQGSEHKQLQLKYVICNFHHPISP
nr:MAG TPA: hypothetical protein [Caudoviricetes sp.]